jgi:hypothetical protein
MGWLERKFYNWGIGAQKREIDPWLDNLRSVNGDEVGALLAVATHIRHGLELRLGVDLLDPILTHTAKPDLIFELHRIVKHCQSTGQQSDAAGVMVWLFTLRCGAALELRQRGRELWKELQRGYPHVKEAADSLGALSGKTINIDGFDRVPIGLEPSVQ